MSTPHKSEKPEKTEKATHHAPKTNKQNKYMFIVLIVAVVLVGLLIALQTSHNSSNKSAKTTPAVSASQGNAKLYVKTTSNQVSNGTSVTFEVWVDTADQPVNAVQANLTYPADKFDFNSIDAKGSAFEVQAMSKGGDGKISIARGHIGDVKGQALVAKIVLAAKAKGDAKIEFTTGSAVVKSTDHTDILKEKTGGSFKVSLGTSSIAVIPLNIT
jgi:flagellar basal body-associated protein FliL